MDIPDEDIDAAIEKLKPKYIESNDSDSSNEDPDDPFDVCAYVETQMMNEYSEYEGDNSFGGTQIGGTTKSDKKQLYECMECDYVCQKREALIKHIDTHFNIEIYSTDFGFDKKKRDKLNKAGKIKKKVHCTVCSYRCTNKWRLKDHMAIHSDEKPFTCDQCDFKTKHKLSLKMHTENKHDGKKSQECTLCEFKCTTKPQMLKHMTEHLHEQTFACIEPDCDFETKNVDEITEHIDTHDALQKSVMCPKCEFTGYTKEHIKAHMRTHKKKKAYKCTYPDCDYRGAKKEYLKLHLMRHAGEKPHQCQHCEYRCVSKSKLLTHLTIHSDNKPHQCHICDYKCALKDALNKHIRTHTKPLKCSQCSFRCAKRHYLNQHMLKHTGEKPFACDKCDFRSTSKTLLNSHLLVHSTDKPHACEYCPYATNRKQELTRHVERMHNEFKPARRRPRGPRQPKIQSNEIPPEAVLPQPGSLGHHGTIGPGGMGMPMPGMGQMPHMALGGYQFPHNAHGHLLWNQHTIQQL
ncbi:unnamed protein product [Meganyctiphanes norvegica]|uniref:C2H2-type domain-containing protein n=1 Tax=Meganyctiphanes norvegica TaxID=48144 RepID=A0AAV2R2U7_MEGNR